MKICIISFALILSILFQTSTSYSQEQVEGEVIIKYTDGFGALRSLSSSGILSSMSNFPELLTDNTFLIKTDKPVDDVIDKLKDDVNIEFVQPNYIYRALVEPNDPVVLDKTVNYRYKKDIGINAFNGWDINKDASSILVGVLDSGINMNHNDLLGNIENNGIDTTTNIPTEGYGAGVDVNGHGTHVAGIIGAICDNAFGSCGIAWRVKLMPLRVLNSAGRGTSSGIIKAIDYAVSKKVNVINASLGGDINQFPYAEHQALKKAISSGIVVIAAAGNADNGKAPYNTDISPSFPAGYGMRGLISVGASNINASSASFSYYGTTTVHLFAPGVGIYSTSLGDGFEKKSGTSMSTPMITGVVALMLSMDSTLTPSQVEMILINSTDTSGTLKNLSMTSGIINLEKALTFVSHKKSQLYEPPKNLTVVQGDSKTKVYISWEGGEGNTEIYSRTGNDGYRYLATVPAGKNTFTDNVELSSSRYLYKFYRIRSVKDGIYSPFLRKEIASENGSMAQEYIVVGDMPEVTTRATESGSGGCSISKNSDYTLIFFITLLILKTAVAVRRKLS